jgi:hypothetical protein
MNYKNEDFLPVLFEIQVDPFNFGLAECFSLDNE